jgi:hypothetical protein
MSSISGSMSSMMSPADRLQASLQQSISSGSIPAADQAALSSAITDIDATLSAGFSGATSPNGSAGSGTTAINTAGASTDPGSIRSKVDDLIDQETSNGKLTNDQATELKQVFAQANNGASQKAGGHHGHGHHGGGGGANALSAILDDASQVASLFGSSLTAGTTAATTASTGATSATSATASTSAATAATTASTSASTGATQNALTTLIGFLQQMEQAMGTNATYGANGASNASLSNSALLINSNA